MDPRADAWVQHSVAEVHATTFILSIPRARLEPELVQALPSATLEPLAGSAPGQHPVLVELWQVRSGHLAPGGIDTLMGSEQAGSVWGGVAGGLLGAATFSAYAGAIALLRPPHAGSGGRPSWLTSGVNAAMNQAFGALLGALEGAKVGADVGSRTSHGAAQGIAQRWGTYQEILLAVPGVHLNGESAGRQLVLGMYTDSSLARWGERVLGYGFGKRPARISQPGETGFEALTPGGESLFRGRWSGRTEFRALPEQPALVPRWWAQPLIGLRRGQPVLSHLERQWRSNVTEFREINGSLEVGATALPGLIAGRHAIDEATGEGAPPRAFQTRALRVRLSFPRRANSRRVYRERA